jgi:hypothetical protein
MFETKALKTESTTLLPSFCTSTVTSLLGVFIVKETDNS